MNHWGIPAALEAEVLARDRRCVYCGVSFETSAARRGDQPSWEHIVNDARILTAANIARCCRSCNASKGAKRLCDWLHSAYCARRGISLSNLAEVVRAVMVDSAP